MSKKTKINWKVPFDASGNLLNYAETYGCYAPKEWRDNYEFSGSLSFKDFRRGRSAANAILEDKEGHTYTMFLTDFKAAIPYMVNGKITGRFTFCKRGANYGVKLAANPTILDQIAIEAKEYEQREEARK